MVDVVVMDVPERTRDQRMEALKGANEIRSHRAQLKRDLKAGRRAVVDVLRQPTELTETMKLFDVLLSTPKVGRVKASTILRVHRISPSKTLGGLSSRQRGEIVAAFEAYRRQGRWQW